MKNQSRPQARIYPILHRLQKVWEQNPDLRLGQLITIIEYNSDSKTDLFNIEDDVMLKGLIKTEKQLE